MNLRARLSGINLDYWGIWASVACAIHCAVFPILVSMGGFAFLDTPFLEVFVLGLSLILAMSSLVPSYFHHHRKVAIITLLVGFVFIGLGHAAGTLFNQIAFTVIGALGIALAHFINIRLKADCKTCCN